MKLKNMSDMLKAMDELESSLKKSQKTDIKLLSDERILINGSKQKIYVPSATGKLAHCDDSFVRVLFGPYGSGKSTWAISEIVRRACGVPMWIHSRRRSRWAIVRNTSGELQSTTLQTWLQWFGDLGDVKKRQKPILTYEHHFNDGNGIVELELLFIALDRPDDVRKIKSLELTGCYINELSEVPKAAFAHMKGRVNRYPSKADTSESYWSGIIADTNPPDEDHWIYKDFEENPVDSHKLFKQPPGLIKDDKVWVRNPDADNINNLPDDYYVKLAQGQTEEFVKVYCLGQYGTVGTGRLVFPEFNSDIHSVSSLDAIQGKELYLGFDFGLTPACVVTQMNNRGQLLILKEYVASNMGLRNFVENIVIPSIKRDFPYCTIAKPAYADPAGNHRSEIIEEMSCIGELNQMGIETIGARTNDIDPRLAGIRYFLSKLVDGKPTFIIDKHNCPTLFKGFAKDYIYQRLAVSGEERYKDKPLKNMSSHPMDALGYVCMELASQAIDVSKPKFDISSIYNPVMR